MKIGGLEPLSFCDFPDIPAAVIFTQGCNWRCPYCHNKSLLSVKREQQYDIDRVLSFLSKRRKLLEGVVVSGGEPSLQDNLLEFIQELKAMHFHVKLDTNGSRPSVLETLLSNNNLDYIAMDIKAPWEKYDALTGMSGTDIKSVKESMNLISSSSIRHHFRTTYPRHLLNAADIEKIRGTLPQKSPYLIQTCKDQSQQAVTAS